MNIDTLDLIEQALDAVLKELRRLSRQPRVRKYSTTELSRVVNDECVELPEEIASLMEVLADPLKHALTRQLHNIGCVLYAEVGTTDGMKEVAEWVASLDVEDYEFRIEALDNAFLGVGAGADVWRH